MEKMLHAQTGKWLADGSTTDGYTRIPMYGEKVISKITPSMDPITGINMKRMLARIDIRNNSATSNFTVEEVYLANYNTTDTLLRHGTRTGRLLTRLRILRFSL